jgi:hypothetical protein
MLPVIEMLERDNNQVLVPQLGLPNKGPGKGLMQLSQLDGDNYEYIMLDDENKEEDDDEDIDESNEELVATQLETVPP